MEARAAGESGKSTPTRTGRGVEEWAWTGAAEQTSPTMSRDASARATLRTGKTQGPIPCRATSPILRHELPQHVPGTAAVGAHAALVGGAHAVDPDAVEADGRRIETRGARGQIVHPAL